MKTLKIQIPNMQSAHCQMRVANAVRAVEGAAVNSINPGRTDVSLKDESLQSSVIQAIEKAGYSISSLESEPAGDDSGKTFNFKTNINCSGCVAKVTPQLDGAEGICHWSIDTASKDKVLSVHSKGITKEEVVTAVQKAGFNIELINS